MLGRQALRSLLRSGTAGGGIWKRSFADAPVTASPAAHEEFIAAWKKVAPFVDPPKTPLSFMAPRPNVPTSIPTKVTLNFVLPYQTELSAKEGARMISLTRLRAKGYSYHFVSIQPRPLMKYMFAMGFGLMQWSVMG